MKITNFRLVDVFGNSPINWRFKAVVTVETGMLFWKKKLDRMIYMEYASHWVFCDTGEFTPGDDVERLVRMLEAKEMKSIDECKCHPELLGN